MHPPLACVAAFIIGSMRCRYQRNTLHSCYHVREYDFAKLMLLSGRVDIMLSHDWPQGVCHHGNLQQLLRHKPFLKQDLDSGELGNPHAMQLMRVMRPRFWFSAHMHCKFPAHVQHAPSADPAATAATQFLALDKVAASRYYRPRPPLLPTPCSAGAAWP